MSVTSLAKTAGVWAGGLLLGLGLAHLPHLGAPRLLTSLVGDFSILTDRGLGLPFWTKSIRTTTTTNTTNTNNNNTASSPPTTAAVVGAEEEEEEATRTFVCDTTHAYRTELVSLDPLIMYIHDLITPAEIAWLLETGEPRFAPSQVTKYGRQQQTPDRTSSSAGLPRDDPAVMCVLDRTRAFLGTMLRDGWDEMGPPQLVRYTTGQRFNLHHDWFDVPQRAAAAAASDDGEFIPRRWNRVASFFAILEDDCTGGETYFPYAKPIVPPSRRGEAMWQGGGVTGEKNKKKKNKTKTAATEGEQQEEKQEREQEQEQEQEQEEARPLWREHEDDGLAFRPVAGNAVFWVNLHANGTGDPRTNHAGLPLESGRKTAMNIWPRQYYP